MIIFPAIDLKNGACVRLAQGDFGAATCYEADPLKQAKRFEAAGAIWLHIVDLDGAKDGAIHQLSLIQSIAEATTLKLQVGGGIRASQDIDTLLTAGAKRVIVGSMAVRQPDIVCGWLKTYGGDKIVLALDVRLDAAGQPEVLTQGWQEGSTQSLWNVLDIYKDKGLKTVLCTDIARDGMMTGSNHALYAHIRQKWPALDVLASGGIHHFDDLKALTDMGMTGAIVGKALYEGAFNLKTAIKALEKGL